MLLRVIVVALVLSYHPVSAAESEPPAQVMLFGVFHFADPGEDMVRTTHIDVMTPENQAYLQGLAERIAEFRPTVVLLEFNPENQARIEETYREYLEGASELGRNEIYQLGFRIAALANLDAIYSFDERSVGWEAEALFHYMEDHDSAAKAKVDNLIAEITQATNAAHQSGSLRDLLMRTNDPEQDRINKSFYLLTNPVGAGENFLGADAAASWWRRNFRMYANIQKYAQPGERVVAIGGQGHTAILRDLLEWDTERVAVDVRPYIFGK